MFESEMILSRIRNSGIHFFKKIGLRPERSCEYDFAFKSIPIHVDKILDVGSTGSLFPLKLAKAGFKVHVIDSRLYHEKHRNLKVIKGDITQNNFSYDYFDIISCISTIEHIGLSAYGDPECKNGDFNAFKEFKRIIKNDGYLIITTPFSKHYCLKTLGKTVERIYNWDRLKKLFEGWNIINEEYYIPIGKFNWKRTGRAEAEKVYKPYERSNLSCYLLEKNKK
jgi:SAM-dependent methyltransferase